MNNAGPYSFESKFSTTSAESGQDECGRDDREIAKYVQMHSSFNVTELMVSCVYDFTNLLTFRPWRSESTVSFWTELQSRSLR